MSSDGRIPALNRYCFLRNCKNTRRKNQNKNFFPVPRSNLIEWCTAGGLNTIPKRQLHICEDHLNLEDDLENYSYWRFMHSTQKIHPKLKPRLPASLRSLAEKQILPHLLNLQTQEQILDIRKENEDCQTKQVGSLASPELGGIKAELDANIDGKLISTPMVYTKKLDHMNILRSPYTGKTRETILNEILNESKPLLKHYNNNHDSDALTTTSFRWVKMRITQLNKRDSIVCEAKRKSNESDTSNYSRITQRNKRDSIGCEAKQHSIDSNSSSSSRITQRNTRNSIVCEATRHSTESDTSSSSRITQLNKRDSIGCETKPNSKESDTSNYAITTQRNERDSIGFEMKRHSDESKISKYPTALVSSVKEKEDDRKKEMPSRTAKLLKMCKPCIISVKKLDCKNTIRYDSKQFTAKTRLENFVKHAFLCIIDTSINETDIFYVQDTVLIEYHKLKGINEKQVIAYKKENCLATKIIRVCCWYARENHIAGLADRNFPEYLKRMMKRPHKCQYSQCRCCCGPFKQDSKTDSDKPSLISSIATTNHKLFVSPEDMEIQDLEQDLSQTLLKMKHYEYGYNCNWLQDLLSGNNSNTFINKALLYNPPKENKKKIIPEKTIKVNSSLFKRFLTKSNNIDIFQLTQYGDIKMYAKDQTNGAVREFLDKRHVRQDDYTVCCWYRLDKIADTVFCESLEMKRFLKSPHTCPATECSCCCKPITPAYKLNLGDITLPNRTTPLHTVSVTKVTKVPRIKSAINNLTEKPEANPVPYNIPITIDDDDITVVPVSNLGTTDNDVTKDTRCQRSSVPVTKSPANPQQLLNVPALSAPETPKMPVLAEISPQSSDVDSYITTILQRFKNVKLTLNESGEIAAALNAPVDSLSTAELKVLANILAHAQKQVQDIRLANTTKNISSTAAEPVKLLTENTILSKEQPITTIPKSNPVPVSTIPKTYPVPGTILSKSNPVQTPPKDPQTPTAERTREKIYKNFAELLHKKSTKSLSSFKTYVNAKLTAAKARKNISSAQVDQNGSTIDDLVPSQIPVISNVFSLKDADLNNTEANKEDMRSALKIWSEEPTATQNAPTLLIEPLTETLKRKTEDATTTSSSKIRVVDPSKLGIGKSLDEPVSRPEILRPSETQAGQAKFLADNRFLVGPSNSAQGTAVIPPMNNFVRPMMINTVQNSPRIVYLNNPQIVCPSNSRFPLYSNINNAALTTINNSASLNATSTYRIESLPDGRITLVPVSLVATNTVVAPQSNQPPNP